MPWEPRARSSAVPSNTSFQQSCYHHRTCLILLLSQHLSQLPNSGPRFVYRRSTVQLSTQDVRLSETILHTSRGGAKSNSTKPHRLVSTKLQTNLHALLLKCYTECRGTYLAGGRDQYTTEATWAASCQTILGSFCWQSFLDPEEISGRSGGLGGLGRPIEILVCPCCWLAL